MPLKTYGIYVAYPPTVDLRSEGLGRYLASFLKGASTREDVEFVIACPSWSREMLKELLSAEGVPTNRLRIVSPKGKPHLLRLFEVYQAYLGRTRKPGLFQRIQAKLKSGVERIRRHMEMRLANGHSLTTALPFMLETIFLLGVIVACSPFLAVFLIIRTLLRLALRTIWKLLAPIAHIQNWLQGLMSTRQNDPWVSRMFTLMADSESARMHQLVQQLPEVSAWYCPTAFWPAFNNIDAPRLMCVPDIVLTDFPVGFSSVGGNRYLETFETIKTSIRTADHMVTYSDSVKWNTLVDRFGIAANKIVVIHHAPQQVRRWVEIRGFPDDEAASKIYCQQLLRQAFSRSVNPSHGHSSHFNNEEIQFFFYASQFRPNKNLLNLLRAYKYLLRKRFIGHKLILTGRPSDLPAIDTYISEHNLGNDVLCLYGLTVSELAACYKLADLAVNPSLSEGGCPFTFTEALSVSTPVVMSRIAVSEEVLTDPELQRVTFFDPYDWKDIANRMEWALQNRDQLLETQQQTFEVLKRRTWATVATEHIDCLDRISKHSQEEKTD